MTDYMQSVRQIVSSLMRGTKYEHRQGSFSTYTDLIQAPAGCLYGGFNQDVLTVHRTRVFLFMLHGKKGVDGE